MLTFERLWLAELSGTDLAKVVRKPDEPSLWSSGHTDFNFPAAASDEVCAPSSKRFLAARDQADTLRGSRTPLAKRLHARLPRASLERRSGVPTPLY